MNRHVNAISGRLSLRPPQRESLEILARVAEIAPPKKDSDVAAALQVIQSEYPSVVSFERDFPSLCFALATGVGKTRLMGAFVSYLYLAKGIRHFFVLAPNLTIYRKLIADFTPGNRKYVLAGIAEFATNPPLVITGDDYERGQATRARSVGSLFEEAHINIFNISKINAEVRGGKAPRIKRLAECIGESYFDYLAGLDDLVLIMDESHRYRADSGVRVLNELKPILGLELTATPQVETGARVPVPFENVIYSYPLSSAISDGFVKEPAVATRENFKADAYTKEQLEQLKLEDGVRVHEATKVELETYARNHELPIVKPFMLVVAEDTTHANELQKTIEDDSFFEGRYRGRVITVHSNQRGNEKDEVIERLLAVESPDERTEIVIHVNMLKEGWDVTNLYTIVPLRKANSRTLVEQSIGRGLRLPYGKRVGVPAVDRLTIVAHDHFEEIINEANRPDSVIRTGVIIGRDIAVERKQTVEVKSVLESLIDGGGAPAPTTPPGSKIADKPFQQPIVFPTPADQQIARTTFDVIRKYEKLPKSQDLRKPEIRDMIIREVAATYSVGQQMIEGFDEKPDVEGNVVKTIDLVIERSIDIPRIIVVPTDEVTSGFKDFDLDVRNIHFQPVEHDILIHHLQTNMREKLISEEGIVEEPRPENYLVRALMEFDDISYDDHADLLYKLSGQVVAKLRSYLKDDDELTNVLQFYQRPLAELIYAQMQEHYWESQSGIEVHVSNNFTTLRPNNFSLPEGEAARNFRAPVNDKQYIRGMLFTGFACCLFTRVKFDSDTERRFAVLLEDTVDVEKWLKPGPGRFQIYYRYGRGEQAYEPDFIVETHTEKLMCEIKSAAEMDDPVVDAKAKAAVVWCERATEHEKANGGKPWRYALIPHDAVTATATLNTLFSAHERGGT
jgi:type III restriction enzyme